MKRITKSIFEHKRCTRIWFSKKHLFILSIAFFCFLLNVETYAQETTIVVNDEVVSLKELIDEIEKQSGYLVVYSNKEINTSKKVNVQNKRSNISNLLAEAFEDSNVNIDFDKDYIVLSQRTNEKALRNNALFQDSQKVTVKGKVTDEFGDAAIGVNVIEKGTSNGTITDTNGNYSIMVSPQSTLTFSFISYLTDDVEVSNQSVIDITLIPDISELSEVIVVGYGVQKKKLITGATVQVKGDKVERLNTPSVLGALQSQTAGVNIMQSSGQVGENYKINIRGLGTTGNNEPLYVVDGVAGGSLNSLNPSDIESIDVLKDAASAAIYGARAANGVILITTKQGQSGDFKITYDTYYGVQNAITNGVTPLNAKQYMEIINKALLTQDESGALNYDWTQELPEKMLNSINKGTWTGTNWLEEGQKKNAPIASHAINLTGGTELSKFSMGFSYLTQDGTIGYPATPHFDRYTFRINSQHAIYKHNNRDVVRFGENIIFSKYNKSGVSIGSMYSNNVRNLLKTTPLLPLYNDSGDYYLYQDMLNDGWKFDQGVANPIAQLDYTRGSRMSITNRLHSNFYLEILPAKDLVFKTSAGYKYYQNSNRYYVPAYQLSSKTINDTDDITQGQSWNTSWSWENTLNYNLNTDNSNIDFLIGQSVEKWGYGQSVSVKNSNSLFPGSFDHAYIDNSQGLDNTNTSISGSPITNGALSSFFGRINYNFQEKYLASIVSRYDGSSNFARGNRWGFFPSISAGWVLSEEVFMENIINNNFLKLRGSWGQNGNCDIDNFQYLATIAFDTNAYYFNDKNNPTSGAYPDILPNEDVTWETSEQLNLGLDARFIKSKLGVSFDWYVKKTKDWLVVAPTLATYGTGAPYINGGDVENRGRELVLSWDDKLSKDFSYNVTFNMANNKNKVLRLANEEGIIHGPDAVIAENTTESFRVEVGYPMGYFWGYKTLGVFQNQAEIDKFLADGGVTKQKNPVPGDLIFHDTTEDGVIDKDDKTMIGNPHPKFTGNLNLTVNWKAFDFSIAAYGAFGHQILKSYRSYSDTPNDNYTTDVYSKYWTGEGSTNKYPAFAYGKNDNFIDISDIYVENGDYVKFSNITLGFDIAKVSKKIPFSQFRVYVTGQNLFTITKYSGMDPEVGYGAGYEWASGIDCGYYPSSKTIMGGINLKF